MDMYTRDSREESLSEAINHQTDVVLEQLDCIEDTVGGVQSDIQQLRLCLTRLDSLRSKLQVTTN